ncbi:MAG: DUF342 domain-containing protein [Planctomycetota bacterium]|nr:MAG: DUF342 domain-containing protein [Planctomycetota bacterium]
MNTLAAPQHPQRLGAYRVNSLLGNGPLGQVFLGVDTRNQRPVALRLFTPGFDSDDFVEALGGLVDQLRQLDDPLVVPLLEVERVSEGFYVAMDFLPGGDLQSLLRRQGGVMELTQAMTVISQAAKAVHAAAGAGIFHADLKPGSLLLDLDGRVHVGNAGIFPLAMQVRRLRATDRSWAYTAPELASTDFTVDARTDMFGLGAILFRLLSGTQLFSASDPHQAMQDVRACRLPDLKKVLPQVPDEVRDCIARCCARRPDDRYPSLRSLLDALEQITDTLLGQRRAGAAIEALDGLLADRRALRAALEPAQLRRLSRMVQVVDHGLKAVLRLAPGASFKRQLLEVILAEAGIRYGIDEAALNEATRSSETVRLLVVARGEAPTPARPGRDVRGDAMAPLMQSVQLRISDDGLQALALVRPGRKVQGDELDAALAEAKLNQSSINTDVLVQLRSARGLNQECLVLATGRAPKPGQDAGWRLLEQSGDGGLRRVRRGDRIACWTLARPGIDGIDVHGLVLPAAQPRQAQPEDLLGVGVELRQDQGEPLLLASQQGGVIRRADGVVEVQPIHDVEGDVDASRPPVESDEMVVVHGSVRNGGIVQSAQNVVILGDVEGGEISAGGDIVISGEFSGGGGQVCAGGGVQAGSVAGRRLIASSLQVSGVLHAACVHVAGDVRARAIVGGEVVCGGSIEVEELGDADGATTIARCGTHLQLSERQLVARLRWQKISADRRRLLARRDDLLADQHALELRSMRHRSVSVSCAEALAIMQQEIAIIDQSLSGIREQSDSLRHEVMEQVESMASVDEVRGQAHVLARHLAYPGVQVSIADGEAEELKRRRRQYRLGFGPTPDGGGDGLS